MAEKISTVRPWCPFCGDNVEKPREPINRKVDEFTMGVCQCGAIYTSDPTGHNIGAAMVEALVHACGDNWDMAWDLVPEDDYLTGRLENYDETTNQVADKKNIDGRRISGILYFVRLNSDIAEIVEQVTTKKKELDKAQANTVGSTTKPPEMEPARDPKRKKKRAKKYEIKEFADKQDIDSLVDFAFDDVKTLRFLQRLLYDPEEDKRWLYAWTIGKVCRRLSTRKPGAVSDLLQRLYEASTDSAATHWGLLETIGSIIINRPDIFGAFTRHIYMFRGAPSNRIQVLWALGSIAEERPDLVRNTPYYVLIDFIQHPDSFTRGHAVRLFGNIQATEVKSEIKKLIDDEAQVTIYEKGQPVHTTVGKLAEKALESISKREDNNE